MSTPSPGPRRFRDRRYAETVREIKETALRQYAALGDEGLALRAIAREMGLSAQALYHYFRSREDLLTALIVDGYNAAADAVAAGREVGAPEYRAALIEAALAYRRWAVDTPHVFRLVYGDLIPGYRAPADGPTAGLGRRLGHEFAEACFPGWTTRQFAVLAARLDRTTGSSSTEGAPPPGAGSLGAMPPVVRLHFAAWWAQLHGLISLEVYGHLGWVEVDPACTYRTAVEELADRIHALTEQS